MGLLSYFVIIVQDVRGDISVNRRGDGSAQEQVNAALSVPRGSPVDA